MRVWRTWILLLLVTGLASTAQALSWAELEKKVLDANPEIANLNASVRSATETRDAAWGSFWPQIALFADQTRRDQKAAEVTLLDKTIDSYGIKTSYELFSGFASLAEVDRANASVRRARSQLALKSAELRYGLRAAYIQWSMARKSLKTSQAIIQRQRRNRDLIRIKYDNGLEARWALEQAEVAVSLAEWKLDSDLQTSEEADQNIRVLVQAPVDLQTTTADLELTDLITPSAKDLEAHPQLTYLQSFSDEAESLRRQARAEFLPFLTLSHTWSHATEKNLDAVRENAVSLTLTWKIFDGFASMNRLSAAAATAQAAGFSESATRQRLDADLQQLKKRYDMSRRFLKIKNSELRAAETRAETVSNQYRNGLRKYADWEAAQARLIEIERDLVEVEKQTLLQKADWERTLGKALGDPS